MTDSRRIVITGLGLMTAAGPLESTWEAVKQGTSHLRPLKCEIADSLNQQSYIVGEMPDFKPIEFVPDRKLHRLLSRHDFIGIRASNDAIYHSQMIPYRDHIPNPEDFNDKTGIFAASPGNAFSQQYDYLPVIAASNGYPQQFGLEFQTHIHPMWLLRILPNNVLGHTGILHGFRGTNYNLVNHSVAGLQIITEAMHHIRMGNIDRAVVVGYERASELHTLRHLENIGVLGKKEINSFDECRTGTLTGEGAGALVLESLDSALERNAKIYAELIDGTCYSESAGVFSLRKDGEGLKKCINKVLEKNNCTASDIGMITAHANGTQISDASEAYALHDLFDSHSPPPVTGFKWCFGHCFTAAGIMDTVLTALCVEQDTVPPIATLHNLAPECAGINVDDTARSPTSPLALVISRGFGSFNAALLMKKYEN